MNRAQELPVGLALIMAAAALLPLAPVSGGPVAPVTTPPLRLVSQGVTPDLLSRQVIFKLVFNQTPDLFTVDHLGRVHQSFQVWYDGSYVPTGNPPRFPFDGPNTMVIRGPELAFTTGNLIPIRDARGFDGTDPRAGGWGPIRDSVPFELSGQTVRFSVPFASLKETDSNFRTSVYIENDYGPTPSVPIPLPPAVLLAAPGLALAFGLAARRTIR